MANQFMEIAERIQDDRVTVLEECKRMIAFVAKQKDKAVLAECKAQAAAVLEYLEYKKGVSVEEHNAAVKVHLAVKYRLAEYLRDNVKRGRPGKNGQPGRFIPDELGSKNQRQHTATRLKPLLQVPLPMLLKRIDADPKKVLHDTRIVKELVQEQQRADNKAIVEQATPLADVPGVFQTIVIDPPWDWGDEGDVSQLGRGRHEYAAMSFDELLKLPVGDKADKNCHLYLWITNRSLPKGFALMEAWGFRYVTCLTWCKPSFGMGNYFRGSTEHVLFGVKGSLALLRKDLGTWFAAPRHVNEKGEKHSVKPPEFFGLVESCSPGPWLEMFARSGRNGWVTWGAEADVQ